MRVHRPITLLVGALCSETQFAWLVLDCNHNVDIITSNSLALIALNIVATLSFGVHFVLLRGNEEDER